MSSEDKIKAALTGAVSETVAYARTTEKIISCMERVMDAIKSLGEIVEVAPYAKPELAAALESLGVASEALVSAHKVAVTTFDLRVEELLN